MAALLRLILAASLALGSASASAQFIYTENGSASFRYPDPGRPLNPTQTVITGAANGGVRLTEPVGALKSQMGGAAITAGRVASKAAVARAAARLLPGVGQALAIAELAEALRCQAEGGGWMCDEGEPQVTAERWRAGSGPYHYGGSAAEACSLYAATLTYDYVTGNFRYSGSASVSPSLSTATAGSCLGTRQACQHSTINGSGSCNTFSVNTPVTVDGTILSCDKGGSTGRDGLCKSGDFPSVKTPRSVEDMGDAINQWAEDGEMPGIAEDIVNADHPIDGLGEPELSGPASATGQPHTTTTTGPNGTTSTTTTNNYSYTYGGNNVTVTTTTTTVTTLPDGTTETTTEGDLPPDQQPEDGPGLCDLYPDIVACQTLGDAPPESPLEERTITADMTEAAGFADSAACPAPRTMHTSLAGDLTWSWQPYCDFADMARPIVLAVAALCGLGIFFGVSRRDET